MPSENNHISSSMIYYICGMHFRKKLHEPDMHPQSGCTPYLMNTVQKQTFGMFKNNMHEHSRKLATVTALLTL